MDHSDYTYDAVHPNEHDFGISQRDWLAAMAMQGILSNPTYVSHHQSNASFQTSMCYKIADAMMEERDKT